MKNNLKYKLKQSITKAINESFDEFSGSDGINIVRKKEIHDKIHEYMGADYLIKAAQIIINATKEYDKMIDHVLEFLFDTIKSECGEYYDVENLDWDYDDDYKQFTILIKSNEIIYDLSEEEQDAIVDKLQADLDKVKIDDRWGDCRWFVDYDQMGCEFYLPFNKKTVDEIADVMCDGWGSYDSLYFPLHSLIKSK